MARQLFGAARCPFGNREQPWSHFEDGQEPRSTNLGPKKLGGTYWRLLY